MSVPTSKMLKASKSIMAIADLKNNSPTTTNSQNVNVIVNTSTPDPDKKVAYPKIENPLPPQPQQPSPDVNPYANLPNESNPVQTRDIESAIRTLYKHETLKARCVRLKKLARALKRKRTQSKH